MVGDTLPQQALLAPGMPCPVLPSLQASCPCLSLCIEEAASLPVAVWVLTAIGVGPVEGQSVQPPALIFELSAKGDGWVSPGLRR